MVDHATRAVASAVPSGFPPATSKNDALRTAHTTAKRRDAFTLAELLVSVGVLVLLVLLATQLLNSAATITTLGHKQMDADSQARQLLDRMAIDFAQMVKRSDVDYYVKSSSFATGAPTPAPGCSPACSNVYSTGVRTLLQPGNDKIAFYSTVPGYYPPTGSQSPLSLVAYRVNSVSGTTAFNKLERMGKGLVWNAVSTSQTPIVFRPIPLASPLPTPELPDPAPDPIPCPAWPEIACPQTPPSPCVAPPCSTWSDSEVIGPQVFRFEYYYLLKGQTDPTTGTTYAATVSDTPWDTRICSCTAAPATPTPTPGPASPCCHKSPRGMQDVAAVVVVIAVIDPKSRVLLTDAQMTTLAGTLIDYGASAAAGCPTPNWQAPGELRRQWQCVLDGTNGLPRPAISGIRVYERYLYLSPPTLLTP